MPKLHKKRKLIFFQRYSLYFCVMLAVNMKHWNIIDESDINMDKLR